MVKDCGRGVLEVRYAKSVTTSSLPNTRFPSPKVSKYCICPSINTPNNKRGSMTKYILTIFIVNETSSQC